MSRRLLRITGLSASLIVATGYICWNFLALPEGGTSVVAGWRDRLRGRSTALFGAPPFVQFVAFREGAWRLQDPDFAEHQAATDVVAVSLDSLEWKSGFWHPIFANEQCEITFSLWHDDSPFDDGLSLMPILKAIRASDPQAIPEQVLDIPLRSVTGPHVSRRLLWLGVVGDLSVLAAFAVVLFSLVRLSREFARRVPGQCVNCGYDLRGLRGEQCPECGASTK